MSAHDRENPEGLTPDEWETVKDKVFACHAMPKEAQRSWLDAHCPPGRVRAEVERLLGGGRAAPSFMSVPAPQQLLAEPHTVPARIGRFKIERELGAGGMGIVYAAVDERLGRHVALKVLKSDAGIDAERRKRLAWDARAASALNHPNIVTVYETGDSDGVDYVAMELVPGRTLADALHSEPWPVSRVAAVAAQIAAALEAAHAQGIVHRDLKPSNVILTTSGTAKLVDFGLAKSVGGELDAGSAAPTTIEGRLAGTVAYMSPEQAEGTDVDFRSDIFSFGSLLYEMLTRQRAFGGTSTVSILAKIIHTQPPIPSGLSSSIDPRLQDIVDRCLRKDRARRFQSMGEVRVRLQEILDDPAGSPRPAERRATPAWKYVASIASLIALVAIGAAIALASRGQGAPSLRRLTFEGGMTTYPAVSRDGTLLAFASDRGRHGNLDIWIERLGGGDPIPLTSDPADDSAPDISPDGTRVAYRSERGGGGVYVVPSTTGTERLIAPECRDPKYSPGGDTIACWIGDVGGIFYPKAARIVLVPAAGGPVRTFRPDFDSAASPLWTPDGRLLFLGRKTVEQRPSIVDRLLFRRKPEEQPRSIVDWWIAGEAPGQGEQATGAVAAFNKLGLQPVASTYWIRPEAWQSGGRAVLFSARREDATNVWSIGLSSRGVSSTPEPVTTGTGSDERPAPVSLGPADRESLVFARVDVEYQLRRVALSGDAQPQPLLPALTQIGSPSASADGRVLVYSERQPNGYRVAAVNMATSDEQSVTTVESPDFVRVVVSGDGKVVVYGSFANRVVYRMRLNQGQPEPICPNCGWTTHVNADGSAVIFEAPASKADERLVLWSNGVLQPLIASVDPKNRRQYAGRFSPNGHWVALSLTTPQGGAREIVVVPFAPDRKLRDDEWISISDGETSDREPAWSPDGKRLYFISDRDGFRCIWRREIDPETGHPHGPAVAVAHFHYTRELLRGPMGSTGSIGLTATASGLVFTVARSIANLWWQRVPR